MDGKKQGDLIIHVLDCESSKIVKETGKHNEAGRA
jgi:hypothetical protein